VEQVVALLRAKAKLAGMLIEDRMIDATQACLEYLETAVPPEQRPSWLTESPEDTPQAWR
jgi:ribonuclease D